MNGPAKPTLPRPSCVAITQQHRGHGASTAAYYLGRALVGQGLRVLLGDLSLRRSPLATFAAHEPLKNLVAWAPPAVTSRDLPQVLQGASQHTAGVADVILLDIDATLLLSGGGLNAGIDYVVTLVDHTVEGQSNAQRLALRLGAQPGPRSRVGAVFSRVEAPLDDELPTQLENGVPVLGWLPADYLLAAGEAYSLKGGRPAHPHEAYLHALSRLAQTLMRLVPLKRATPAEARTAMPARPAPLPRPATTPQPAELPSLPHAYEPPEVTLPY